MDEMTDAPKPITGFFQAWWAFIKVEYSGPRNERKESAQARSFRLSRFRITQNQADAFQMGGIFASIGIPLYVLIAYEDWFTDHDILVGKFHGNIQGFAAAAIMFFAGYLIVSFLMTLVWLVIRKPLPPSEASNNCS